jgi:hypothetical protein
MKKLTVALSLMACVFGVDRAFAQNPAGQTPGATPAPVRTTQGAGVGAAPKNIRFDIAIADSGAGAPVSKSVTLNVSQGGSGSIRSTAPMPGTPVTLPKTVTTRGADGKESTTTQALTPSISLNVDVSNPLIYEDGYIRAIVVIEYQPYVAPASLPSASTRPQPAVVRANSMSVFESGKKMVLLQAADPLSDRRTIIEVTATILR